MTHQKPAWDTDNAVAMWDLTLSVEHNPDREQVHKFITSVFKKWAYQREKSDGGYDHWQIRGSLFTKRRGAVVKKMFGAVVKFHDNALSPTSNAASMQGEFFYVMKADTRIEGPWTDRDKKPKYIQERFREAVPICWQSQLENGLLNMQSAKNDRNIVIKQDAGNEGKSWFKGYMKMKYDNVVIIPASMSDPGQMIEYLCSICEEGGRYIVLMDVPRATSKKHWFTLAAGLETIKQGFLYDHRYKGRELVIEPPQICVFCNTKPPPEVMTKDVFIEFIPFDIPMA